MENFEVLSNAVYDAIEDGEVAIKVSCVTMNKLIEMNKELLAALEGMAEVYGSTNDFDWLPKNAIELELIGMARKAISKAKAAS